MLLLLVTHTGWEDEKHGNIHLRSHRCLLSPHSSLPLDLFPQSGVPYAVTYKSHSLAPRKLKEWLEPAELDEVVKDNIYVILKLNIMTV